jgi:hypothetical protein
MSLIIPQAAQKRLIHCRTYKFYIVDEKPINHNFTQYRVKNIRNYRTRVHRISELHV